MPPASFPEGLDREVRRFVRKDFQPHFDQFDDVFPTHILWRRMRSVGSLLWLDTGAIEEVRRLWTAETSALTTNNSLLEDEVATGRYDALVREAAGLLDRYDLSKRRRRLELAFILNAYHGLRLVERFDAYVSVEEHTDLAHESQEAVAYGRRFHEVCPERFIVKVPLTPAGVLAARRLADEGVPVNQTLGFGARQNYLSARIARPDYVNVFLGRLNAFVADNGLGDGTYVGERATLASQAVVRKLRQTRRVPTRQIAASIRAGGQIRDLAGTDVLTMPPKAVDGFLSLGLAPDDLRDRSGADYHPPLAEGVDPAAVGLHTLWDVDEGFVTAVEALEHEAVDAMTPGDLVDFFERHGCGDALVHWTDEEVRTIRAEGKIPRLATWRERLASRAVGLDSLMNLAGLGAFTDSQEKMDEHVAEVLKGAAHAT